MTRFQKLALATAGTTIVLFSVGGLVRGSGSGLGCSTWPECHPGQLFPSGTVHSLIEFSHRALAFLVIVLTLATGLVLWRQPTTSTSVKWAAALAFPLVLAQAVLGGIVVATELNPWWVTAHFIAALVLIADVMFVAAACLTLRPVSSVGGDQRCTVREAHARHAHRGGHAAAGGHLRPSERCATGRSPTGP